MSAITKVRKTLSGAPSRAWTLASGTFISPTNFAAKRFLGDSYISRGVPICLMLPLSMAATPFDMERAPSWS